MSERIKRNEPETKSNKQKMDKIIESPPDNIFHKLTAAATAPAARPRLQTLNGKVPNKMVNIFIKISTICVFIWTTGAVSAILCSLFCARHKPGYIPALATDMCCGVLCQRVCVCVCVSMYVFILFHSQNIVFTLII